MPSRRSAAYVANLAPLHVDLTRQEREQVNVAITRSGLTAKDWLLRAVSEHAQSNVPAIQRSVLVDASDALQIAAELQDRFADLASSYRRAAYRKEQKRFQAARRALLAYLGRAADDET